MKDPISLTPEATFPPEGAPACSFVVDGVQIDLTATSPSQVLQANEEGRIEFVGHSGQTWILEMAIRPRLSTRPSLPQ